LAGRRGFGPLWKPRQRYLLDHSLNPNLAQALRLADWDVLSVTELFGVSSQDSIDDSEIIRRCAREGRIWVSVDVAARRQHAFLLQFLGVSVLWVSRPKEGMSTAYQHALLTAALLRADPEFTSQPHHAIHFTVGSTLNAKPKEVWRQRRQR
jgi:hypothetical protein